VYFSPFWSANPLIQEKILSDSINNFVSKKESPPYYSTY
jgi:hypothetical protein